MTAAAFSGDYCDLKFVKTRKVAQITVEIPIEQAAAFVAAFGAPNPSEGVPVALARLQAAETPKEPAKERKSWNDLPCSQQAAIRCGEPAFWRFLTEERGMRVTGPVDAADGVRQYCEVQSRSDIDKVARAQVFWENLDKEYQLWLRVPV